MSNMQNIIFTHKVKVTGGLGAGFCFQSQEEVDVWMKKSLPELEKKYGSIKAEVESLPGLKVGETCNVWGDGHDQYTIKAIIKYSDHRYGFHLSSGVNEEVVKCHREFI